MKVYFFSLIFLELLIVLITIVRLLLPDAYIDLHIPLATCFLCVTKPPSGVNLFLLISLSTSFYILIMADFIYVQLIRYKSIIIKLC